MTKEQALLEAKKRWGASAFVRRVRADNPAFRFRVGFIMTQNGKQSLTTVGVGRSWDDAFLRADAFINEVAKDLLSATPPAESEPITHP